MTRGKAVVAWACLVLCAAVARAGDDASAGETETRALVRGLGDSTVAARRELCTRLETSGNVRWAAVTALECLAAADDRLQKAVAERDKQGARMFAFFVNRVARDFESRAKFTEFRVMELENRTLCGSVQDWNTSVAEFQEACRKATARVTGDAETAALVAERARRIVVMNRRPTLQAAVMAGVRGDAVRLIALEAHQWAAAATEREPAVVALRLLALVPDTVDVAKLTPCVQNVDPVVRRVAYRLLSTVATAPAIDLLVARLALEEGVPSGEIIQQLHALTEETFPDAELWAKWWAEHRATWTYDKDRVAQAWKIERQPYSRYFGLELRSARVLFVIDRSGSMTWGVAHKPGDDEDPGGASKMSVATRELAAAVQALDERTSFNVVGYSTSVEPFQKRLVRATKENREKAARWIARLVPDGQTNLAGSLLCAFENTRPMLGQPEEAIADTIVVLSDGAPNCGPIAYEADTLAELRRLDPDGMVTVHAIFLGVDGDEKFMRSLAEEHGGKFVHHKQ